MFWNSVISNDLVYQMRGQFAVSYAVSYASSVDFLLAKNMEIVTAFMENSIE